MRVFRYMYTCRFLLLAIQTIHIRTRPNMWRRGFTAFAGTTLLVCSFTAWLYLSSHYVDISTSNSFGDSSEILSDLILQRNNISRLMNLKQKIIGQMECKKLIANRRATSATGGWCANTSHEHSGYHKTDRRLIPVLAELFTGKRVASFGDGPGRYKQLLLATNKLKSYDAYDGAPFSEDTSEGRVQFLDLTLPQYGLPVYDWVLSLEVAEHIPKDYESIFLDNIARHAKEDVVLSWAKLGQNGHSHVNCQPFDYVVKTMERLGFTHCPEESQTLKEAAKFLWLRDNANVYRRHDSESKLTRMHLEA